ncbi:hypothetical protein [Planotetraspora mira]|uniref:Uncharacterized protein n=1 Tax=Planotetraspora mira TaxID=58121 RepID=A0A8J3TWG9_9ACTN|nr:hypothetical protein [Planotetraspora mira]GII34388.1 hypothetical protein Pmi06nite_78300 [Planotetraspora mira]
MASDLRQGYADAINRVNAEYADKMIYLTDDVILDALVAVGDEEVEALRARLARVDGRHHNQPRSHLGGLIVHSWCEACAKAFPCAEHLALHGETKETCTHG